MFYFENINNKKVLKSDIIKTEHFFTTRQCCIKSKEPDMSDIVAGNKQDICNCLKIGCENLIYPSQTHSSTIAVALKGKSDYPETDGLIINDPDIAIFLNFADCTPLIFYDEVKKVGAVSHAGWRGTAANIATKTIRKMVEEFGCNPENISAAIGPAISMCCYNVGQEVYNQLRSTVSDFSGLYEIRNGVENVDVAPYCTCCNNDLFFSYRKENATTNRHSAVLKIG